MVNEEIDNGLVANGAVEHERVAEDADANEAVVNDQVRDDVDTNEFLVDLVENEPFRPERQSSGSSSNPPDSVFGNYKTKKRKKFIKLIYLDSTLFLIENAEIHVEHTCNLTGTMGTLYL